MVIKGSSLIYVIEIEKINKISNYLYQFSIYEDMQICNHILYEYYI